MKQADLDRAVARATGESVFTIQQRGFLLADADHEFDPEPAEYEPNVIDWDELDAQRHSGREGGVRCELAIA